MAATPEDKLRIKKKIREWLLSDGSEKLEELRKRYPEIPKPTFFRWLKEVRGERPEEERAKAIAAAKELAGDVPGNQAAVRAMMPVPVSPAAIRSASNLNAVNLINECIEHGREVLAYCRGSDGKVRNAKGFLSASAHMRASVDTLARVIERVNDAQRINDVLDMMIVEIGKESPELAQRVLSRLQSILQSSGL